ncbi:MAG: Gfo/Idh/MocA family protein [Spirochaetales bacterium]
MQKLRVAMIGCGGYAGAHARRLSAREDVEIVALASRTEASIARLVERRLAEYKPAPRRYTSLDELYAKEELDAVVLSTPHHLHFEQAMQALDAGCHVLIEKPMVTSFADAKALAARVEELHDAGDDRVVSVCYNPGFSKPMRLVREAVSAGTLGDLELVTGYIAQNWKTLTAGSWRQKPSESGGGQLMDSGAHLLHSVLSSVGSAPSEVFAFSASLDAPVDINSTVTIRFGNGVMATITIGGNCTVDGGATSFVFSGGRIDVDAWRGEWIRTYRAEGEPEVLEGLGEPSPDDNFVDAILGKAALDVDARDGLRLAALMDAIYRSAESHAPVRMSAAHSE